MKSHERVSELLLETGAYTDLDEPVILTSGELGIYYINTEKLCQDGGQFKQYGDDSQAMIAHAVKMAEEHPTFKEVIDILSEKTESLIPKKDDALISGGQRRDWIFSGPVAEKLDIPHVSLYKDGKHEVVMPNGELLNGEAPSGMTAVHIVDLITAGSSVYSIKDGQEKGWVPMLRNQGIDISNLLAVVTRNQGGEQMLAEQGVTAHPFVAIDKDFLEARSKDPQRATTYLDSPPAWGENYIREHGIGAFVSAFNPDGGKLDRAKKFVDRYKLVLDAAGKMKELQDAVQKEYGKPMEELSK
ncbi:hypothetical protein ACFLZ7_03930 [Nanoarchaeota archaeon]